MKLEKILIVGGSSLLGLSWAQQMKKRFDVTLGLHRRSVSLSGTKSRIVDFNGNLADLVEKGSFSYVINCSGLTSVENCETNPDLADSLNAQLPARLAQACKASHARFVHISTDHLYGHDAEKKTECTVLAPLNVYAASKAKGETLVLETNPGALVLRTNFFCFGPSYRRSFSDWIIDNLISNRPLRLFGDVTYSPILASELVNIAHDLLDVKATGRYNVASDDVTTKYEFGRALADCFGLDVGLISSACLEDASDLTQRPRGMALSNAKCRSKLDRPLGTTLQFIEKLFEQQKKAETLEIREL